MIRPAVPEDIKPIMAMGEAFFAEAGHAARGCVFDPQSFAYTVGMLMDAGLILVMEHEDKVVGMAAMDAAKAYWNHNVLVGREAFWYVCPAHRKGRDSRSLLSALEDTAKAAGIHIFDVVAEDGERGPALARLYRAAGYNPAETTFRKGL